MITAHVSMYRNNYLHEIITIVLFFYTKQHNMKEHNIIYSTQQYYKQDILIYTKNIILQLGSIIESSTLLHNYSTTTQPSPMNTHPRDTTSDMLAQHQLNRQSNICGTNNSMYNVEASYNHRFFKLVENQCQGTNSLSYLPPEENFGSTIQVSQFFAWTILLINSLFSAFVPCWLMGDIKSQFFTRNSWRFTTVSVLLIPFVMYQQRNTKDQNQKFINCLTKQKLKPIFISSINICVWIFFIVYACKWTSINHAICLSDLKLLVISLLKFKNNEKFHQFQIGGSIISLLGLLMILSNSISLPRSYDPKSDHYLKIQPWKRLLFGDGMALVGSFASYYLDRYFTRPAMPRFTYLFIYNVFLSFNLINFGYFFGGSEFSSDPKFGVFGLYTYTNFVSVFYVSIMLGLTMILTNIFVRQIFSELIINVSSRFEIIYSSIFYHILRVEQIPSGMTCIGYCFLVPGLIFILVAHAALNNTQVKINFEIYKNQQRQQSKINNQPECSPPLRDKIPRIIMPFLQILQMEQDDNYSQFRQQSKSRQKSMHAQANKNKDRQMELAVQNKLAHK